MFRKGSTAALLWRVKHFARVRGPRALSYPLVAAYLALRFVNPRVALKSLMAAHRYSQRKYLDRLICREKPLISQSESMDLIEVPPNRFELNLKRAIVLKKPKLSGNAVEKGVLLLKFTETFAFFLRYVDCDALLKYFYVVLEPSWSGYCDPSILGWLQYSEPVIVQAAERKDFELIAALDSNLVPLSFGSHDWVDFRIFRPVAGLPKKYDAIYVTSHNPIKRHDLLFRAIRTIGDPDYRVALVFGNWGTAAKEIESLIDYYGVRPQLSIFHRVPQAQVNELFNMSKVNMLLSLKEGSNRAIFEGLFANIPSIASRRNIGINKDYINDQTGLLFDDAELPQRLAELRTSWTRYAPLAWALENISPLVTTRKLEACLSRISAERRMPWYGGLVPKVNVPEARYFSEEDAATMPQGDAVVSLFLKSAAPRTAEPQLLTHRLAEICGI